jgi:uncharacterized protein (TIGR03437 family)
MPTALDGVSVTINGQSAYVYYISPTQVNALVPPGEQAGVATVQLTNNGAVSPPGSVALQALSPTFFVIGAGPYIASRHTNGAIVGPTTLYPGSSTPAAPGELVEIFANGFGPTTTPVTSGSVTQSGALATLPVVTIGGTPAAVQFAGLSGPGLYQFNVTIPTTATPGDNALVATYNGMTTQPGVLITVQ